MTAIVETVQVNVPLHTAYNQWTQFETFPHFMEGVESVEQIDDTRTHWKIDIGGIHREFDAIISHQEPDQYVTWESVNGPKHSGHVSFEAVGPTSTRVTAKIDIDPEGFVETVADKLGVLKGRTKGDLERFKTFIEAQQAETGAWRGEVHQGFPRNSGRERF